MKYISFNLEKKQLFFLSFIVFSFLKELIRKLNEKRNKDIAQRLFNIYLYILGDILCFIPYYIRSKNSKKENKENEEKEIIKKKSSGSIELIYRDEVEERNDIKLKKVFIISLFDLFAQISLFLFYLIKGNNENKVQDLSVFLTFNIISKYILSRIILKTYFYCHHYFSLVISLFILIILGILDIIKIKKNEETDTLLVLLYIFFKTLNILFYSFENVYGKKALTTEFLSVYSLLFHKGMYEFFIVIVLSIPLIFVKVKGIEPEEKSIIFSRFGTLFSDMKSLLGVISLLIINYFYNIFVWIIINQFSPSHLAMANIFESFGNSLFSFFFVEGNTNYKDFYFVYFIIYIFLFLAVSIHNEFCVINLCGLNEKTKSFLQEKALLDITEESRPTINLDEINSSDDENDDDDNEKMK